jgi:hypothetical protein
MRGNYIQGVGGKAGYHLHASGISDKNEVCFISFTKRPIEWLYMLLCFINLKIILGKCQRQYISAASQYFYT